MDSILNETRRRTKERVRELADKYRPQSYKPDRASYQFWIVRYSALLGVSVIAAIQLVSLSLDTPLTISAYAFAVSIPLLAIWINIQMVKADSERVFVIWGERVLLYAGVTTSLVGLTALFWHISWVAAVLLVVSGIFASYVLGRYRQISKVLNTEDQEDTAQEGSTVEENQRPEAPTLDRRDLS